MNITINSLTKYNSDKKYKKEVEDRIKIYNFIHILVDDNVRLSDFFLTSNGMFYLKFGDNSNKEYTFTIENKPAIIKIKPEITYVLEKINLNKL